MKKKRARLVLNRADVIQLATGTISAISHCRGVLDTLETARDHGRYLVNTLDLITQRLESGETLSVEEVSGLREVLAHGQAGQVALARMVEEQRAGALEVEERLK